MYVRLDALQSRTEEWVKQSWAKGKWSPNAVINSDGELVDARLKSGLRPSPVTRDLKWGTPINTDIQGLDVDEYSKKVFYVWFDACIGYVSITANYTDGKNADGKLWERWWKADDVELVQFMGKDNVQ